MSTSWVFCVTRICQFFFLLLAFTALASPTIAQPAQRAGAAFDERAAANFYRGKIVRIVVGFPPGGGADVYSRLIARHLGRFIPGNPTLAVSNMPGAGSIIAGNHIFNNGAKDGTEIGMLNGAAILEQLFASPGVHFDMAKFRYLAVPVNETYVMIVARQSGLQNSAKSSDPTPSKPWSARYPTRRWSTLRLYCATL